MIINFLCKSKCDKKIKASDCDSGTIGYFCSIDDDTLIFLGVIFRDVDYRNTIIVDLADNEYYLDVDNYVLVEEKCFELFEK